MNIKVYCTPNCPWCAAAKDYLRNHGFEFEEIDVSTDPLLAEELIKKSGQMGVPVIEIDDELIIGFNKERLNEVLNIKEEK
ncbi:MAG TPA: glutaredoxin domain-containing protein [Candidatus Paceibacterota bacterium]|jgi:glutaredoxin-like YruB-family protein|nr:glutaredoxin domain-containing protein [Candidatus Paceibacterota bacterium]